jgi:hypothetical protein
MTPIEIIFEFVPSNGFGGRGWRDRTLTRTELLLSIDGDHTEPSLYRWIECYATHAPRYAASLQHPWGHQSERTQGDDLS